MPVQFQELMIKKKQHCPAAPAPDEIPTYKASYYPSIYPLHYNKMRRQRALKTTHSPPPCANVPAQKAAFLRTPALESTRPRLINGNAWLMYFADALEVDRPESTTD